MRIAVAAVATLAALAGAVACGSDEAEPPASVSPLVEELIGAVRATTDPAVLAAFDAAQPCLRETFAGYTDEELQVLIDGVRAQDLEPVAADLRQRFRDDAVSCNEENRALDAADYKADAEAAIAATGVTNAMCELPADISVGASFRCTANFQNRTSEYRATIDAVGHVEIERTDDSGL